MSLFLHRAGVMPGAVGEAAGVVASGGIETVINPAEGVYRRVHAFLEGQDDLDVSEAGNAAVLLVGAGGSVVDDANRGGGAAGGLVFIADFALSGLMAAGVGAGASEEAGGSTLFAALTALGGALGGGFNLPGRDGGSGSGAGGRENHPGGAALQPLQSGPSGEFGHGNSGGATFGSSALKGAGGGGAGMPGGNAIGDEEALRIGIGGDGLCEVTINGTTYDFAGLFGTSYGEIIEGKAWFAGGGAGNSRSVTNGWEYPGGKGGGARRITQNIVTDPLPNTGGGSAPSEISNKAGALGIILVSYPITQAEYNAEAA